MHDKEYENNLIRIKKYAYVTGLVLNPGEQKVKEVVSEMTKNYKAVGEYVCPCKQKNNPPLKGKEILCPCPDIMVEILKDGHCYCGLFYSPKEAEKIKGDLVQIERG